MSSFWSGYIILLSSIVIVGSAVLLYVVDKSKSGPAEGEEMPHAFDGIHELNNPLPRWWVLLYWSNIFIAIIYLVLYPGMGNYEGLLKWTSVGQWQAEVDDAEKSYGPIYARFAEQSIEELAKSSEATGMGQRLFVNHCAGCHGSDAGGATGFPNLSDSDWLYGGSPDAIKTTILEGRGGMMPAMGAAVGGAEGVEQVTAYVQSLSGRNVDAALAEKGKVKFDQACFICHGSDGKGNQIFGAPNLTDNIWLYGGTDAIIRETIMNGRTGKMPAHKDLLSEQKVHVIAAYIYSLSNE